MIDPASPDAWEQAKKIAATAAKGNLVKRSDSLPFMFMADSPPAVLVHEGKLVTEKGPAAAGSYLRDLGIIQGKGPAIADVLFVLYAFDAFPPITEVPNQQYVNVPGEPRLIDLTARIDYDGESAQVVLHYMLPEKEPPAGISVGAGASGASGDYGPEGPPPRPVIRAILDIPGTGAAAWRMEKLMWAEPR